MLARYLWIEANIYPGQIAPKQSEQSLQVSPDAEAPGVVPQVPITGADGGHTPGPVAAPQTSQARLSSSQPPALSGGLPPGDSDPSVGSPSGSVDKTTSDQLNFGTEFRVRTGIFARPYAGRRAHPQSGRLQRVLHNLQSTEYTGSTLSGGNTGASGFPERGQTPARPEDSLAALHDDGTFLTEPELEQRQELNERRLSAGAGEKSTPTHAPADDAPENEGGKEITEAMGEAEQDFEAP